MIKVINCKNKNYIKNLKNFLNKRRLNKSFKLTKVKKILEGVGLKTID